MNLSQIRVDDLEEIQRREYRKSLGLTAKYLLQYPDINLATHGDIIGALQNETKRKLIVCPRGSLKSTLCDISYPIWLLLNNPNLRILIDSEVFTNSKSFLREIKAQLESERLTSLFGKFRSDQNWTEGSITIAQRTIARKEPSIQCSGVGAVKVGMHFDCMDPETKIFSSNGWVKIKDIKLKTRVLAHDGKFHTVIAKQEKQTTKTMVGIRSNGFPDLVWCTRDHKILTFRDERAQWVEAIDITTRDYVALPLVKGKTRSVSKINKNIDALLRNEGVWRLIGYWLADGCRSNGSPTAVRICFGSHEKEYIKDVEAIVRSLGINVTKIETKSNATLVVFFNKDVADILKKFGSCAKDKHLPPFALNTENLYKRELIKGYWRGDGHTASRTYGFVSISESLLSGIQLLLASFGIPASLGQLRPAGIMEFDLNAGKYSCDTQRTFMLNTTSPLMPLLLNETPISLNIKPFRSFFTKNYWWVKVAEIKNRWLTPQIVYDIQVKDCPSFLTNGFIAHNCIIHDDMNSNKNSQTKEGRQKVIDHYKLNISILEPDGILAVVGTRYAEDDVIGHILSNELGIDACNPSLIE